MRWSFLKSFSVPLAAAALPVTTAGVGALDDPPRAEAIAPLLMRGDVSVQAPPRRYRLQA